MGCCESTAAAAGSIMLTLLSDAINTILTQLKSQVRFQCFIIFGLDYDFFPVKMNFP